LYSLFSICTTIPFKRYQISNLNNAWWINWGKFGNDNASIVSDGLEIKQKLVFNFATKPEIFSHFLLLMKWKDLKELTMMDVSLQTKKKRQDKKILSLKLARIWLTITLHNKYFNFLLKFTLILSCFHQNKNSFLKLKLHLS